MFFLVMTSRRFSHYFGVALVLILPSGTYSHLAGDGRCMGRSGEGECKLLTRCPSAMSLSQRDPVICGFEGKEPIVCCEERPHEGQTAEDKQRAWGSLEEDRRLIRPNPGQVLRVHQASPELGTEYYERQKHSIAYTAGNEDVDQGHSDPYYSHGQTYNPNKVIKNSWDQGYHDGAHRNEYDDYTPKRVDPYGRETTRKEAYGRGTTKRSVEPGRATRRIDFFEKPTTERDNYYYERSTTKNVNYYDRPTTKRNDYYDRPTTKNTYYNERPTTKRNDYYERPTTKNTNYYERPTTKRNDYSDRPTTKNTNYYERPTTKRNDYYDRPTTKNTNYYERPTTKNTNDYDRPTTKRNDYYDRPTTKRNEYQEPSTTRRTEYYDRFTTEGARRTTTRGSPWAGQEPENGWSAEQDVHKPSFRPTKRTTARPSTTRSPQKPYRPTPRPKRISEIKCSEYSKRVVDTVAALPLTTDPKPVEINISKCIIPQKLIVGGEHTSVGEFPHMAAIGFRDAHNGGISWDCGGSLISELFVLTAAHCTSTPNGEPFIVRLGELNLRRDDDGASPRDFGIREMKLHPEYRPPAKYNDIALLRLTSEVPHHKYIRPACLYTRDKFTTTKTIATGWGRIAYAEAPSDVLLKVSLNIVPPTDCQKMYEYESLTSALHRGIDNTMLCAGELRGGKDTCQGDSGGPVEVTSDGNSCIHHIIGITSFGKSCAHPNSSGVYTRVSAYIPWIEDIVWPRASRRG